MFHRMSVVVVRVPHVLRGAHGIQQIVNYSARYTAYKGKDPTNDIFWVLPCLGP